MKSGKSLAAAAIALSFFATFTHAAAHAAGLPVLAQQGPRGMVVRWFTKSSFTSATVVRIDQSGARSPAITVTRPSSMQDARALGLVNLPPGAQDVAAWQRNIDANGSGFLATLGGLDGALLYGSAYIDRSTAAGKRYKYEVSLSTGESGTSGEALAGEQPIASHYAVSTFSVKPGDRSIQLTMTGAVEHAKLFNVYRSESGGPFHYVTTALGTSSGPVTYYDPVVAGQRIGYQVRVVDFAGNEGAPSQAQYATALDLHKARPPDRLVAKSVGGGHLLLTWLPSPDNDVIGYDVFKGRPSDTKLAHVAFVFGGNATSYRDTLPPGVMYRYDVRARNRAGNEGLPSAGAVGIVPKTTPPDAPLGLTAKPEKAAIVLAWQPSRDPSVALYEIYRRAPKGKPFLLTTVRAPHTTFTVKTIAEARAAYEYGVGADDHFANHVAPAQWVLARPLREHISEAAAPIAAQYRDGAVTVYVVPLADVDVAAQHLLRSDNGGPVTVLASLPTNAEKYVDRKIVLGHRYAYRLAAVDTQGHEGARSAAASVIVPLPIEKPPAPTAQVLSGGRIVELHWPKRTGLVGYVLVRRAADGTQSVVEPMLRAFAYRDVLPRAATGKISYALREITPKGTGPLGNFTTVTLTR